MMTVRSFSVAMNWPATKAPSTSGAPTVTESPSPTIRTWSNVTTSPGWASIFSILTTSLAATLYCLPPVLITTNVIVLPGKFPDPLLSRPVAPQALPLLRTSNSRPTDVGGGLGQRFQPNQKSAQVPLARNSSGLMVGKAAGVKFRRLENQAAYQLWSRTSEASPTIACSPAGSPPW